MYEKVKTAQNISIYIHYNHSNQPWVE